MSRDPYNTEVRQRFAAPAFAGRADTASSGRGQGVRNSNKPGPGQAGNAARMDLSDPAAAQKSETDHAAASCAGPMARSTRRAAAWSGASTSRRI